MTYIIYWLLSFFYQPFAWFHLLYRKALGKERANRYWEKVGVYSALKPANQLIWFHVASIGELNSIVPLVKKLAECHNQVHFLITTVTITAAKVFEGLNLPRATHQFAPLDGPLFVNRFLKHWKPSLGIFIDSELWPNLISNAAKHCRLVMINGRLSDKSYKRWLYFKSFARRLYSNFSFILASSEDDLNKISTFADEVKHIGHLKYAFTPDKLTDFTEWEPLKEAISKRPHWVATCIHTGEYSKLLKVHRKLKLKYPDLLMIFGPRHISASGNIIQEAEQQDLRVEQRSKTLEINPDTDVYIIDALINLDALYTITEIVFMGGSLIPHGGHNVLEPARNQCAIITGPYFSNFKNIVKDFQKSEAIRVIKNPEELEDVVDNLLSDPKQVAALAKAAKKVADKGKNILTETVNAIEPYIKN